MHIPASIQRGRLEAGLLAPTDRPLLLNFANLPGRGGSGGTAADGTDRTANGSTDDGARRAGHGGAALPLLLHSPVDRVGLGHRLREVAVGVVHDQRVSICASCRRRCGGDEGRGRVHLVIEAAIALAAVAAGAEEDETRVDDGIARAVDGGR